VRDIIGGWSEPERFDAYLDNWQAILAQRTREVVDRIAAIEGVRGLILAGGIGRGAAWPLSDIDLIPIYAPGTVDASAAAIDAIRQHLLLRWTAKGWWTGIDIGRLAFTTNEVDTALATEATMIPALLADDRWYHSIDKAYGGQPTYDPDGLATPLAHWLTSHRFTPTIVSLRITRASTELHNALSIWDMSQTPGDPHGAVRAIHDAVKWLRALLLERWGERDASLARVGTRFDRLASAHGLVDVVATTHAVCDLDDASVQRRMAIAPDWLHLRHDRSLRARRLIGEPVSALEDARDVLRVSTQYALRQQTTPPFPAWLAIPERAESLAERFGQLRRLIDHCGIAERAIDERSSRKID